MLSEKQQKTMDAIRKHFEATEQMPSVRALSQMLGVSSRAIQQQITLLKKKGYLIHQEPTTSSYILPLVETHEASPKIPLIGSIAAGKAAHAFETPEDYLEVDPGFFKPLHSPIALKVIGNSMLGDHISDGDIAIIEPCEAWQENDILALSIDEDECTLKRVHKQGEMLALIPSNKEYTTQLVDQQRVRVIGKFIGLIRRY